VDNSKTDCGPAAHHTTGTCTQSLAIWVTDAQRIDFQKAAERCGLSLAEWMHDRLVEAAKREAKEA
jgi:hypothetical protein